MDRDFTKTLKTLSGSALLSVGLLAGGTSAALADGELNVLTWEGYTDPSFVSVFEEQTGCKVSSTFVGSNDEIIARVAAGGSVFDMVSPAINYAQIMVGLGALEPLDESRLDHLGDMSDAFTGHPGMIDADGTVWSVPMAWGSIPLMYRTDKFDEPPTSAEVLWDPEYAGHIATQDVSMTIFMAARILYGKDVDVYNLSDEQLEAVKQKLIEQKPLLRTYWSTGGDLISLYAAGEVWVSETWGGYQVAELQAQGIPVAEVIPVEKADGWQDVWVVLKDTPNLDCAYEWLNFASGPQGQCGMVKAVGYSPANAVAVQECLTEEELAVLHLDDPDYINSLDFWQLQPRLDAYIETWNAVKTAE